jgi:hypothetical protein
VEELLDEDEVGTAHEHAHGCSDKFSDDADVDADDEDETSSYYSCESQSQPPYDGQPQHRLEDYIHADIKYFPGLRRQSESDDTPSLDNASSSASSNSSVPDPTSNVSMQGPQFQQLQPALEGEAERGAEVDIGENTEHEVEVGPVPADEPAPPYAWAHAQGQEHHQDPHHEAPPDDYAAPANPTPAYIDIQNPDLIPPQNPPILQRFNERVYQNNFEHHWDHYPATDTEGWIAAYIQDGYIYGTGHGPSKKAARDAAAQVAYRILFEDPNPDPNGTR